ncbi:hypothetical protein ACFL3A_05190 [Pseudomonadota bacterium]
MENTITKCLETLLLELNYAIERNIESIDIPLEGDVDILITYPDYVHFIRRAREQNLVISIARVYGGARVYLECPGMLIKRVDFIWRLHYRGINFLDVKKLISERILSAEAGLYVLPEREQAYVVFYIKNSYGGAPKYRELLEKYGLKVLSPAERRKMLSTFWVKKTWQTLVGVLSYWLSYLSRILSPTGLAVSGVTSDRIRNMKVLGYLFQGKICEEYSRVKVVIRSRFLSELCITNKHFAELKLKEHVTDNDIKEEVIACLRKRIAHD